MSIVYLNIGRSRQLYGMVNRLASWQRLISMIYRRLASRTSIQCGHFQLHLSINVWDPITFGMAPWHLDENVDKQKSKEALQSQSPIAAFKACNVIQAIGIAYSKIVLPSGDSKGESKNRTYCPTTWNNSYTWSYAAEYADQLRKILTCKCSSMQGMHSIGANPAQQEECLIIRIVHLQTQQALSCVVQ